MPLLKPKQPTKGWFSVSTIGPNANRFVFMRVGLFIDGCYSSTHTTGDVDSVIKWYLNKMIYVKSNYPDLVQRDSN